jgi:uncharacterized membrane protein YidH (DUF202 family)
VTESGTGANGPAEDMEGADPNLARKRTELAWTRSSLAFLGVGAAILKYRPAIGIAILAIGVIVWLLGRVGSTPGPVGSLGARRVLLVTIAVTGLGFCALALTLATSSRGLRP